MSTFISSSLFIFITVIRQKKRVNLKIFFFICQLPFAERWMPLGIKIIRLKLKKRVINLHKTRLYFSRKLKSIYSVNSFWYFIWFSLLLPKFISPATHETKLNNGEISIIKWKKKKPYQNKFPPKMQEIPTTLYTWYFEWIHFPATDISVPEVSAEYFIRHFSLD